MSVNRIADRSSLVKWYGLLAIIVGGLTALQSRVNGRLSIHLENGILAGFISNLSGWVILTIMVALSSSNRASFKASVASIRRGDIKVWEVLGGFGGSFFLAAQGSGVPVIGIALFTISLVAGQTSTSLLVDKLGISPSGKKPITGLRVITAGFTLLGVTVAVIPKLSEGSFDIFYILVALGVGVIVSFQQAINGRFNVLTQKPIVTAWFNFATGTSLLVVFVAIKSLFGGEIGTFPNNPLLYTGGLLGLTFIAISAYTISELGVLNFIMLSVAGQLFTALLVDALAPVHGSTLSGFVIFGTFITFISIAIPRILELLKKKH
jgi:transporter family-2 protein